MKFVTFTTIDEHGSFDNKKANELVRVLNNNANCVGGFIDYSSMYPLIFVFASCTETMFCYNLNNERDPFVDQLEALVKESKIVVDTQQVCNLLLEGFVNFSFDARLRVCDIVRVLELLNCMITRKMKNNILYGVSGEARKCY
ncbi:Orf125 [Heliothis zea nudivirus]|uniref:Orf125 n=1 Tax=Heliothis zea nudivirus 1 TaxID=3116536 RepID=Q8JKI8_9VIRU|nr:Orf125 [Heliothis zea nudivirus]AAN04418.1 Orf125 [Heliothis zea nudivirus]